MQFEELLACKNGFLLNRACQGGGTINSKKEYTAPPPPHLGLCYSSLFGSSKLFIQEVFCYSQLCCSYEKLMTAFSSTENSLILQKINKEGSVQH